MEAREATGGKPRLLPIKSGPDFVWSHWKVFFLGHAGKVPGVREVLTKVIPENETAAAKTKRIKDDSAHNSTALSMLYEVCQSDGIASGVATKQAASELVPCAQTLFKLLEGRFTQRSNLRLQSLLQQFSAIKVKAGETTADFCDRFTSLTTSILAIDPTHLPTELNRKGVLLSAIVTAFPVLWSVLSEKDEPEDKMLESILNHRLPNEIGKHSLDITAAVAQYLSNNPHGNKHTNKNPKKQHDKKPVEKDLSNIECYNFWKKGQLTVNCRLLKIAS